jgi:cell division protein FtsW (lipid II flippase)
MSGAVTSLDLGAAWAARGHERELLLTSLGCVALGFILAWASEHAAGRPLGAAALVPLLLYAGGLAVVHLLLVVSRSRADEALVGAVAFLCGCGLLAQYRMGAFAGDAGAADLALYLLPAGLLVMVLTALAFAGGRYRILARGIWLWAGLSLVLVAVLLATGQQFRGAVYGLGFTTPTEALKLTVILALAAYLEQQATALARWHPRLPLPPLRALWPLLAYWCLLAGLLALQHDLGMIAILSIALIAMLVAITRRIGYLVYGLTGAGGLAVLMLAVFEHGQRRIDAWLDPFLDPTGDGWQTLQGLSGMFAGGFWGEGFGSGSPQYTPIAESDFIYSVIGEELGFLGTIVLVLFFLVLLQRGDRIAARAGNGFGRLLALGITVVLAVQTLLNIGGVTKAIPLTGVTLPFISHGGASLLTACAAVGLLLAISDGAATQRRSPRGGKPSAPSQTPRRKPRKPRSSDRQPPQDAGALASPQSSSAGDDRDLRLQPGGSSGQ